MVVKGTNYEHLFIKKEEEKGNHCERVAGSGSRKDSICDVVLFKNERVFLVEVKATKQKKFYTSLAKEQLERMRQMALRHNAVPLLAVKFKYYEWIERDLSKGIPRIVSCQQASGSNNHSIQTKTIKD